MIIDFFRRHFVQLEQYIYIHTINIIFAITVFMSFARFEKYSSLKKVLDVLNWNFVIFVPIFCSIGPTINIIYIHDMKFMLQLQLKLKRMLT